MMFSDVLKDPVISDISRALLPTKNSCDTHIPKRVGQEPASVLILLVLRGDQWHIVLTKRPMHMKNHAGQIAFPGGRTEVGENPYDGALRETHEEIGVATSDIHILGRLPSFNAVSQYRVTPFVGLLNPTAKTQPDPGEVEEIFEVPFAFFMDSNNHVRREVKFEGERHIIYDMPWPSAQETTHNVWGMTAMMMFRLYQRMGYETK
ncbi:MAG: CoA pyrophosphatase [Robiginitomaculum sp.]|nr:CoA pyrophosphatase [Robiginitomaculum sp.]